MTTWANGKSSRWRSFIAASFRLWLARVLSRSLSAGCWPIRWWDQFFALKLRTKYWDYPLLWPSVSSCRCKQRTGSDQTRRSMSWWCNRLHMVRTWDARSKSTSLSGGMGPQNNSMITGTPFRRCTITIGRLTCRRATLSSTQIDSDVYSLQ